MNLPIFVTGLLFGFCFSPLKGPSVRFLRKEIEILLRTLADHGVTTVICHPDGRTALLAIGKEMDHKVKDIFLINAWATYRRWLREEKEGKKPSRPGRPAKFSAEDISQVLRIAKENIFSGLGKIVGELKKIGINMSANTVKAILRKNSITPTDDRQIAGTGAWKKLTANVDSLVASDFLTKPIYSLFGKVDAYVLIFIHLGTRKVWMSPATLSPNDKWCRQQAIHASMWIEDEGFDFRHLIIDNDTKFTERFDAIFNELSRATKPVVRTGIHMPKMNAFAESFIGHFKAECLNHFACFGMEQLNYICYQYQTYYNAFRPHQGKGIGNRILDPGWEQPLPTGAVKRQKFFGGLLNHYYCEAA